jgi:hypothetical protein
VVAAATGWTDAEIDELLGLFARTLRQGEDRLGPHVVAPPVAAPRSRH